jgi:NitT/TauT family transport system substrate-binding protein
VFLIIITQTNKRIDGFKTIKFAEVTHSIFNTTFYFAIENVYFKDENINVELLLVNGYDNVGASVLSNDTEIGLTGPESKAIASPSLKAVK